MHLVDIKIECIAQTRINPEAMRRWLDGLGATETPVPITEPHDLCETCGGSAVTDFKTNNECPDCQKHPGKSPAEATDATVLCGFCSKRCYMSFEPGLNPNITRVRKEWVDYWTNVLKSGHGSVTEHASWTFAIEGVSRVFTGEMNRHRAGVGISEGSMRFIRFDDIGFWMPLSLRKGNTSLMPTRKCKGYRCHRGPLKATDDTPVNIVEQCGGTGRVNILNNEEFESKKKKTREIFETSFRIMEENYKMLCAIWGIEESKSFDNKKKLTSMFRRLIGMGVASGGCWTYNARAMRHIMALRTGPGVEEEFAWVMGEIGMHMVDSEPALFGDFTRDEATGAWVPVHVKV